MQKYNLSSNSKISPIFYFIFLLTTGLFFSYEKNKRKQHETKILEFLYSIKEYQVYEGIQSSYIKKCYTKQTDNSFVFTSWNNEEKIHQFHSFRIINQKELLKLGEKLYKAYLNPILPPSSSEYMSYAKIIFNNGLEIYIDEIEDNKEAL